MGGFAKLPCHREVSVGVLGARSLARSLGSRCGPGAGRPRFWSRALPLPSPRLARAGRLGLPPPVGASRRLRPLPPGTCFPCPTRGRSALLPCDVIVTR